MRRSGLPRAQALFLCFTLLLGGFGLPLLDAAWFHSTPIVRPERLEIALQGQHGGGLAHALGCTVLTSAASAMGLPALGAPRVPEQPQLATPARNCRPTPLARTAVSPGLPRAPPSA
jgi:hypothetical protein